MRSISFALLWIGLGLCLGVIIGSVWRDNMPWTEWDQVGFGGLGESERPPTELPLVQYSFERLRETTFSPADISITRELATNPEFSTQLVTITTLDKTMTGQLNLPAEITPNTPVIVMLRGYVAPNIYTTGLGTRNAAAAYARAGFITLAPDFFGYAGSDPEPEDSWQARFEKPVIVAEILEGVRSGGVPTLAERHTTSQIGLWGHSNGGQIGLSVLEILQEPIPATFWAPVTAPFPYSILFFSIDHEDEGRGMRLWVHQLESLYNLQEFSITRYVDGLRGPLMIHHGSGDEAALNAWSSSFAQLVRTENAQRETWNSTASAALARPEPIPFTYHVYPGADHNLQPGWNIVVERDIAFFRTYLDPDGTTPQSQE